MTDLLKYPTLMPDTVVFVPLDNVGLLDVEYTKPRSVNVLPPSVAISPLKVT
ncbi:hypothetical protein D3C72_1252580 [compost metagenome]